MVGKRSGAIVQQLLHKMLVDLVRDEVSVLTPRRGTEALDTETIAQFIGRHSGTANSGGRIGGLEKGDQLTSICEKGKMFCNFTHVFTPGEFEAELARAGFQMANRDPYASAFVCVESTAEPAARN